MVEFIKDNTEIEVISISQTWEINRKVDVPEEKVTPRLEAKIAVRNPSNYIIFNEDDVEVFVSFYEDYSCEFTYKDYAMSGDVEIGHFELYMMAIDDYLQKNKMEVIKKIRLFAINRLTKRVVGEELAHFFAACLEDIVQESA